MNAHFEDLPAEPNGSLSESHDGKVRRLANALHRLNQAITEAVDAGLTVEILRTSRYHNGGQWGDQFVPVVKHAG